MDDDRDIAREERLAEAAYSAMYDAPPYLAKAHYEDAREHLGRAIAAAKGAGQDGEARRLAARRDHIAAVYDNQFRGVGR